MRKTLFLNLLLILFSSSLHGDEEGIPGFVGQVWLSDWEPNRLFEGDIDNDGEIERILYDYTDYSRDNEDGYGGYYFHTPLPDNGQGYISCIRRYRLIDPGEPAYLAVDPDRYPLITRFFRVKNLLLHDRGNLMKYTVDQASKKIIWDWTNEESSDRWFDYYYESNSFFLESRAMNFTWVRFEVDQPASELQKNSLSFTRYDPGWGAVLPNISAFYSPSLTPDVRINTIDGYETLSESLDRFFNDYNESGAAQRNHRKEEREFTNEYGERPDGDLLTGEVWIPDTGGAIYYEGDFDDDGIIEQIIYWTFGDYFSYPLLPGNISYRMEVTHLRVIDLGEPWIDKVDRDLYPQLYLFLLRKEIVYLTSGGPRLFNAINSEENLINGVNEKSGYYPVLDDNDNAEPMRYQIEGDTLIRLFKGKFLRVSRYVRYPGGVREVVPSQIDYEIFGRGPPPYRKREDGVFFRYLNDHNIPLPERFPHGSRGGS